MADEGSKIHAAHYVPAGRDRFRGQREIRFTKTVIDFKVSTLDTDGGLAVCEIIRNPVGRFRLEERRALCDGFPLSRE